PPWGATAHPAACRRWYRGPAFGRAVAAVGCAFPRTARPAVVPRWPFLPAAAAPGPAVDDPGAPARPRPRRRDTAAPQDPTDGPRPQGGRLTCPPSAPPTPPPPPSRKPLRLASSPN